MDCAHHCRIARVEKRPKVQELVPPGSPDTAVALDVVLEMDYVAVSKRACSAAKWSHREPPLLNGDFDLVEANIGTACCFGRQNPPVAEHSVARRAHMEESDRERSRERILRGVVRTGSRTD